MAKGLVALTLSHVLCLNRTPLVISQDSPWHVLSQQYAMLPTPSACSVQGSMLCCGFKENKKLGSTAFNSKFKAFQSILPYRVTQQYFYIHSEVIY